MCLLHFALAELFAAATLRVIEESGRKPSDVDLIGLHGQTFWHSVEPDGKVNATLPKDMAADSVTMATAVELLSAKAGKGPSKRPVKKKPAAKKSAAKKG